ncbi:MAG: orotidine-5'-phosphate decarboxylase [Candidatus Pacebacteria bacterium]|nr:orotidine-5'-phosphate decarboxylase [Candidatus Paceibacterota bacterium]
MKTQLIFACDTNDYDLGMRLIKETAPEIDMVKIGLAAITNEDGFGETLARHFRIRARECKKNTMWDIKLLDVANTVGDAARNIVKRGNKFFTLHAQASNAALEAAVKACEGTETVALAVTALTDLNDDACLLRFDRNSHSVVMQFAEIAYSCGIRGFVCSAQEAQVLRARYPDVTIVTPAIRPLWTVGKDEQKRVTTPTQAAQAGADYIVVGRPILHPPPKYTNLKAAQEIKAELEAA